MSEPSENQVDHDLLTLLQKGRRDAFEILFKKYYRTLWRHSFRFTRNSEVAEDIVQEFFINLWQKNNDITVVGSVSAYFHIAVKNRSLNYLRKKVATNLPIEENLELADEEIDHLVIQDLSNHIEKGISLLPERCRIIFLLSRDSLLSYKEIAEQLDISIKTVETQMGIALKKLKEYLVSNSLIVIVLLKILKFFFTTL